SAPCSPARTCPLRPSPSAASPGRSLRNDEGPGSLPGPSGVSDLSALCGEDELVPERELEPREGVALELPDALPRQAELLTDRLERGGLGLEAEAELDDAPLPLGQVRDRALHALPANRLDRLLGGIDRGLVGEQIAELRIAVRAEALVQGDGVDGVECLDHVREL